MTTWLCAELRDETTLEMLTRQLKDDTAAARVRGIVRADAQVYIAPYKKWHRVFFNEAALAMLPVLEQLAHAPCDPPEEHERRLAVA